MNDTYKDLSYLLSSNLEKMSFNVKSYYPHNLMYRAMSLITSNSILPQFFTSLIWSAGIERQNKSEIVEQISY